LTLVLDASVVAAALIDTGPVGRWAEDRLEQDRLAAPHLLPAEVVIVIRRAELRGRISPEVAAIACVDLLDIAVEFHSFEHFAPRVWQLCENVTVYDAWYVAVAESLDASLATLDRRLATAPGPACSFELPPD
jgi:predicted nucleic acid-binding protein